MNKDARDQEEMLNNATKVTHSLTADPTPRRIDKSPFDAPMKNPAMLRRSVLELTKSLFNVGDLEHTVLTQGENVTITLSPDEPNLTITTIHRGSVITIKV